MHVTVVGQRSLLRALLHIRQAARAPSTSDFPAGVDKPMTTAARMTASATVAPLTEALLPELPKLSEDEADRILAVQKRKS